MNDLVVTQVGRTLILSFTTPRLATDGRRLTKPIEVEVFRQVTPPGTVKPSPAVATKPWLFIKPQDLARFEHNGKFSYPDEFPAQAYSQSLGDLISFAVITFTRGFRGRPRKSDLSNTAQIKVLNVSPPINTLTARQIPGAIELCWSQPAKGVLSDSPLPTISGYRIYRAVRSQPDIFTPAGDTASTTYEDTHFQFGQTYLYKVRAVFAQDSYRAMTADSQPVEITPRDIFPPAAPAGLSAVYTGVAVELLWKPNTEPDLAGYNIYRQERGRPAERLNQALLRTPVFTDRAIARGARYTYWVTAVDAAHNESKPSLQKIVEVR